MENLPEVVSREEWLAARKALLVKEKALTWARDQVNAERRRLPMVRVDRPYAFEGPDGRAGLLDLFEGRRQLVMHHFMWTYDEAGRPRDTACSTCSAIADGIARPAQLHLRDTTLVGVSRVPYDKIAAFRERMGWTFPWYSSAGDFAYDFHATVDDRVAPVMLGYRTEAELAEAGKPWSADLRGDWPGLSAFLRDGDAVYHTYSTFGRGLEPFLGASPYLDLTALGRQEEWEEPAGRAVPLGLQAGGPSLRLPDEYGTP
ncbi:DUF899 domain-containing protein [Nonomuraea sp. NPDC050643]|uniref:DUF899 domain-containing protein n=1 Tax=Nonomuraea sp. NPDC050643 TaxID=3155660 RepID=UPI0033FBF146